MRIDRDDLPELRALAALDAAGAPVRRPWIDGPTVAALIALGAVTAPVVGVVVLAARRFRLVRR